MIPLYIVIWLPLKQYLSHYIIIVQYYCLYSLYCVRSLWLIYLLQVCTLKYHQSSLPIPYPLVTTILLSVLFCVFFPVCLFQVPHVSDIIQYLSISIWFILLSIMYSRSIYVFCTWQDILFYHGWIIFHCIYVPHLFYPFICWWVFGLFPYLGYYKSCCDKHGCANILSKS